MELLECVYVCACRESWWWWGEWGRAARKGVGREGGLSAPKPHSFALGPTKRLRGRPVVI